MYTFIMSAYYFQCFDLYPTRIHFFLLSMIDVFLSNWNCLTIRQFGMGYPKGYPFPAMQFFPSSSEGWTSCLRSTLCKWTCWPGGFLLAKPRHTIHEHKQSSRDATKNVLVWTRKKNRWNEISESVFFSFWSCCLNMERSLQKNRQNIRLFKLLQLKFWHLQCFGGLIILIIDHISSTTPMSNQPQPNVQCWSCISFHDLALVVHGEPQGFSKKNLLGGFSPTHLKNMRSRQIGNLPL